MSDGRQLSGSSAHTLRPPKPISFMRQAYRRDAGALMHTEHLSPPPCPPILSSLHSCSPPHLLVSHEPATMIDPTSNSTVTCKSIYVHIYYPYQIHTDVFLHLLFSEPLALSYRQSVLMAWWRTLQQDGNECK